MMISAIALIWGRRGDWHYGGRAQKPGKELNNEREFWRVSGYNSQPSGGGYGSPPADSPIKSAILHLTRDVLAGLEVDPDKI
jgi:hypothetical protein